MNHVSSTSDQRTVNNTVRHSYRVLSDVEKARMASVKDKGAEFIALIDLLRTPLGPLPALEGSVENAQGMAVGRFDRELCIAAERIEEAVMWAVKHITA